MTSALPAFVVLKSMTNPRYLCLVVGDEQAPLQLSGENIFALRAKYAVEAEDGLVHIRCCYNNKYWATLSEADHQIAAQAEKPKRETSVWSCTLFEPIVGETTVRFRHVQLNRYVSVMPSGNIEISQEGPGVEFEFIDWGTLCPLPRHVAFKDDRSRYLSARQIKDNLIQYITGKGGHNYMQFTGEDIGDQAVRNDVIVTADGYVRIKSLGHDKFWRLKPNSNWIWADSNDDNDPTGNHLFRAVKINDSSIALRSNFNNLYCRRETQNSRRKNCLRAAVAGITREAHLEVKETVISRIIHHVNFRLKDARTQENNVIIYATDWISNNGTEPSVREISFTYKKTRKSKWSSNVSLMFGVKPTIKAVLPSILEAALEISGEISREIQWGEEKEEEYEIIRKAKVTVPQKTCTKIRITATRGTYEVPFSYAQSDLLTNGDRVYYRKDDGVHFCENYSKFQQSNEEKPIKAT